MNEERFPQNEQTLDRAIALIRQLPVPESPGAKALLAQIPSDPGTTDRPIPQSLRTHRSFLLRPALHFATAAAVALLAVGWLFLSSPVSIALAQVIEATTEHRIVSYTLNTSADFKDSGAATLDEVVYVDLKSPRFRIERHEKTLNDTVQSDWVTIQDKHKDRVLVTSSLELIVTEKDTKDENQLKWIKIFANGGDAGKKARLFRVSDAAGLRPFTFAKSDKTFLEILRALESHKEIVSTKDTLNGRNVRKYRLEQNDTILTLWVDAMTRLPIRIEQEVRNPSPNITACKWVYADFLWDVDGRTLDELFSTKPPEGYTLEDHINGK
jgi:hypothetical protein